MEAPPPAPPSDLFTDIARTLLSDGPAIDDAQLAGFKAKTPVEALTWERVYSLALVKRRGGAEKRIPAASLDPKTLADDAKRLGVDDFARFRENFLAGEVAFPDPSAQVLDLLRRLMALEAARADVGGQETLKRVVTDLMKGETGGLTRLQLDQADALLLQAERRFMTERGAYRDALERLKVSLGLAASAPVVIDRSILTPFFKVFDAVTAWSRDPNRDLSALSEIVSGLPPLTDPTLDRLAGEGGIGAATASDDAAADLVAAVDLAASKVERAIDTLGPAERSLRVRRRVRRMIGARAGYAIETRNYVLAVRARDHALERLITPSVGDGAAARPSPLEAIRAALPQTESERRLVELWAMFQTERLGLARDLQTLPANDWPSFYRGLLPAPAR